MSGLEMLPGNKVKEEYIYPTNKDALALMPEHALSDWSQSREAMLRWTSYSVAWADLGTIELIRAQKADEPELAHDHYVASKEDTLKALANSPSNSFYWLRLAQVDVLLEASPAVVLTSLCNSIRTAPYEPIALYPRLLIGFTYWDNATPDQQEEILSQIKLLVPAGRLDGLENLARRFPSWIPVLRSELAGNDLAQRVISRAENN